MTSGILQGARHGSLLQRELLADGRSIRIGAINYLNYREATVLTHDKWKFDAGGIPQFSLLLATAQNVDEDGSDDDEVLLLRVEGTAPLAMEDDLLASREEALRNALAENDDPSPSSVLDVAMDPFTRNHLSFTGLRCKILGTFYEDHVDGQKIIAFGADVDNFYATESYRVLKPTNEGLSAIASYQKPSPGNYDTKMVRLGTVRYSATRRRAQASGESEAAVSVNIHDFIGHKTGLLGMTRTGKSNTAKTLIARTFVVSEEEKNDGRLPIGQLIFDPQGEYANDNPQDDSAIAAIGPDHVRIFKFGANGSQAHVRPLGINFFDPGQIAAAQSLIADKLKTDGASGYVNDFASTDFADVPGDYSATTQAQRGRLALYGSLLKAGFKPPTNNPGTAYPYSVLVNIKKDLREKVTKSVGRDVFHAAGKIWSVQTPDIIDTVEAIVKLRRDADSDAEDFCKDLRWTSTEPIFSGESTSGGQVRGFRNLIDLRSFHDASTTTDPADEIYDHLLEGKIVIVDLHVGTPTVIRVLSENVTRRLLKRQTEAFTSGVTPDEMPRIQVMLEEAHNLFSSDRYREDDDVWIKLAKEAAKLNIGMAYATQEVSGVAHQVKANTANWVVAHLNNTREVDDLGAFYDFASFSKSIIAAEDKGYVRLKSMSSPYIVSVQIDRYGLDLVNKAREAAGEDPLDAPDVTAESTDN